MGTIGKWLDYNVKRFTKNWRPTFISAAGGAALLSGCSIIQPPPVPGVEAVTFEPVRTFTVVAGIKCELAKAMVQIRKNYKDPNPRYKALILFPGEVTITMNTRMNDVGELSVSAMLPFGMNSFGPSASASRNSAGTQEVKTTFEVDSYAADTSVCDDPALANVNTGGFISKALIALHEDISRIPVIRMEKIVDQNGKETVKSIPYGPTFRSQTLNLSASFAVVYNGQFGVSFMLMTGDKEIGPGGKVSAERTDTHTVLIRFPLKPGQPPTDSRRILECTHSFSNEKNMTKCLDRPINEEERMLLDNPRDS